MNVSKLAHCPHVTAGCGGFVDITARAKRVIFSGFFTAGAKLEVVDGKLVILNEGNVKKLVEKVEHVTFSGRRALEQGQQISYITERCVLELRPSGLTVTEIAPGVDLNRDVLSQAAFALQIAPNLKVMDTNLFHEPLIGLQLKEAAHV